MVMIAQVNIGQFVIFLSILFNRRCSEPVRVFKTFVIRLSNIGNKMVDIVNQNTWNDLLVNCYINQFSDQSLNS